MILTMHSVETRCHRPTDRPSDRPTDNVTYRAAITARKGDIQPTKIRGPPPPGPLWAFLVFFIVFSKVVLGSETLDMTSEG